MTTTIFWQSNDEQYAGFWRRLGAMLIDVAIFLPLVPLDFWLSNSYRLYHLYQFVPNVALQMYFSVYLVYRYGGTPGKLLMRIRITSRDGSSVSLKQALLRYAPTLSLSMVTAGAFIFAVLQMSDAQYLAIPARERTEVLVRLIPGITYLVVVSQLWMWSEVIVMLTNRERRALHDFIAGTIVIKKKYVPSGAPQSLYA